MPPPAADRGTQPLGAGLTWTVSVALLAYLGNVLDGELATSPVFLLVGAVLGAVGGFIHFLSRVAPDMLPFGPKGESAEPGPPSDSDSDSDPSQRA